MNEIWTEIRLGDLVSMLSGGTPSKAIPEYWNGDVPWISATSLHVERLEESDRRVTKAAIGNGTRLAPTGASLILVRGMSLLEEIRVGRALRPVAFNQDVKALVPNDEVIDSHFLTYALLAKRPVLLNRVHQAGHGTGVLATERIAELPIPLPPLAVQRRIAGVLGALDDLIDTNKRLISQLDDVAAAIFNRSITIPEFGRSGPGPGPSLSALRELCSIRSGYAFKSSSWLSDGTPVLQIRNVGDGFIDARSVKYVSSSTTAGARNFVARTGDILIAMTGYVGSVARVGLAEDGYLINQRVGRIESIATSRISSEVLYRSLRMPDTKDAMINVANGSAQANLSAHDFGTITIAVPDLETQARVTHVLKVLDSALDELRLEQFSLVRTRDELLPVLLSGQLSVSEAR